MMRVAIGPFDVNDPPASWPLRGLEDLAKGGGQYHIIPFGGDVPPANDVDVLIVWSPEYAPNLKPRLVNAFRVAVIGDWHVVPFSTMDMEPYDLLATDRRGVAELACLGKEAIWFRQFSFDPELHFDSGSERPIDIAFWGRPDGGRRDALLERLRAICERHRWRTSFRTVPYQRGDEANVYRFAKLVWNLSARGELNMRAYEAPACGAVAMLELDNADAYPTGYPAAWWQESTLEQSIEAWLSDEPARNALREQQSQWVQKERPQDHLLWLLRQIPAHQAIVGKRQHAQHPDLYNSVYSVGGLEALPAYSMGGLEPTPLQPLVQALGSGPVSHQQESTQTAAAQEPPPLNEQRLELLPLIPEDAGNMLDLGCGNGGLGWALRQRRADHYVVGIDRDTAALAIARTRMSTVYAGDLEGAAPWVDPKSPLTWSHGWDCVVLADLLEHLHEPAVLLARLRSVLSDGGCVVASIPNVACFPVVWDLLTGKGFPYHTPGRTEFGGPPSNIRCVQHLRFFGRADIETMFQRAGYRIEEWAATHMAAPSLERACDDTAFLLATHGQDAEGFKRDAWVAQFLLRAVPEPSAVAQPADLLPT